MSMIFVFGSNLIGIHGAGAAKYALLYKGAKKGEGIGHHGMSYGIPTKNHKIRTMPISAIKPYVIDFIRYAELHPELKFQVTQVGCGLAGYTKTKMAPLFLGSPKENCYFDSAWKGILGEEYQYWGSI